MFLTQVPITVSYPSICNCFEYIATKPRRIRCGNPCLETESLAGWPAPIEPAPGFRGSYTARQLTGNQVGIEIVATPCRLTKDFADFKPDIFSRRQEASKSPARRGHVLRVEILSSSANLTAPLCLCSDGAPFAVVRQADEQSF
jgi:hypothetical protein